MKSKEKHVEKFAGMTPKDYEDLEDRHKKVLKIFSKYKFNRILDIGCGDGNFSLLIGKACKATEVYGIEISEKGTELAKKNGIKAYRLDVDGENLPFEENFFDAIFAGEVIEHLYDPDHFLEEIYRVLRPEGVFVLTTPNLAAIHNRVALLFGYQPFPTRVSPNNALGHFIHPGWGAYDHIRVMTLKGLLELLKIHEFEKISISASGMSFPSKFNFFGLNFIKILDKAITRISPSLGYHTIMEVKKG